MLIVLVSNIVSVIIPALLQLEEEGHYGHHEGHLLQRTTGSWGNKGTQSTKRGGEVA